MRIFLWTLPALLCVASAAQAHEALKFFERLTSVPGYSGTETTIRIGGDGQAQISKASGGYGYSRREPGHWGGGFGFCGDGKCWDGAMEFFADAEGVYVPSYEGAGVTAPVSRTPLKITESTPSTLGYSLDLTYGAVRYHSEVRMELRDDGKLLQSELNAVNGQFQSSSLFIGAPEHGGSGER